MRSVGISGGGGGSALHVYGSSISGAVMEVEGPGTVTDGRTSGGAADGCGSGGAAGVATSGETWAHSSSPGTAVIAAYGNNGRGGGGGGGGDGSGMLDRTCQMQDGLLVGV